MKEFEGIIIKGIGGFYYVEAPDFVYECRAKGRFRKEKITPLCGDFVKITVDEINGNLIDKIYPRKNVFKRPPVANVDIMVIVISTVEPSPNFKLVDLMTSICINKNIEPVIVITKNDLKAADEIFKIYSKAGFRTFEVNNKTGEGVDNIKSIIKNNIVCFCGNSGVGKSTLLNKIDKRLALKTSETSKKLGRGKHTTREATLLNVCGGRAMDTAGFSSFTASVNFDIKKEDLKNCFPDFEKFSSECSFKTCVHINEKKCGVKNALLNGEIESSRYKSYLEIWNELKAGERW